MRTSTQRATSKSSRSIRSLRTSKSKASAKRALTTGKVLTPSIRKSIRLLTSSTTLASITAKRIQSVLSTFRARAKKLAKASNGKTRH